MRSLFSDAKGSENRKVAILRGMVNTGGFKLLPYDKFDEAMKRGHPASPWQFKIDNGSDSMHSAWIVPQVDCVPRGLSDSVADAIGMPGPQFTYSYRIYLYRCYTNWQGDRLSDCILDLDFPDTKSVWEFLRSL